jgi:CRP-like cAMP-binding protein
MLPLAEQRVVATLLRLAGRRFAHPASPPLASVPITQQEMAVAANLSRSSAGKVLRNLARDGAIAINYGSIEILAPDTLAARLT